MTCRNYIPGPNGDCQRCGEMRAGHAGRDLAKELIAGAEEVKEYVRAGHAGSNNLGDGVRRTPAVEPEEGFNSHHPSQTPLTDAAALQWIPVSTPPTEKAEYVHDLLVVDTYGNRATAIYDGYSKSFDVKPDRFMHPLTHWMLLPKPPAMSQTPLTGLEANQEMAQKMRDDPEFAEEIKRITYTGGDKP